MTETHDTDIALGVEPGTVESLLEEIRLYLEAVEIFRREGLEPRWRVESRPTEVLE